MTDFNCPYCDAPFKVCRDGGHGCEEETTHQDECRECGKAFVFTTHIDISYRAAKADCLNGAPHDWKATSTFPVEYTGMRCKVCDERRPATPEELAPILAAYEARHRKHA